MPARRRFWKRWTAMGAAVFVVVLAWAAYHRTSYAYCSQCWAVFRVDEYGVAWSTRSRLPVRTTTEFNGGPSASIQRFIDGGHVHGALLPDSEYTLRRLVGGWTIACGGPLPCGGFAWALIEEPGFATFLDARIAGGALDVATVRALIATDSRGGVDDLPAAEQRLLATGRELYAAFHHRASADVDVWDRSSQWDVREPSSSDRR